MQTLIQTTPHHDQRTQCRVATCLFCFPLDARWIDAAINAELQNIEALSTLAKPDKLTKPKSRITLSILKIASITIGYDLPRVEIYHLILFSLRCHPLSHKPRKIEYQWRRMLARAIPRTRQGGVSR